MTTSQLGKYVVAVLGAVAAVAVLLSSGLLSHGAAVVVDDSAQLVAGGTATGLCWWMSRRLTGSERLWRRLMAVGMGGWTAGMALWAWYRTFSDTPLPSPSLADVGFFTLPVFALPALLVLAVERPRSPGVRRRTATVLVVLDSLIVVGSFLIIAWSSVLGAVVHAGAPTTGDFVVAIAYPLSDVVLVVIVVLLFITRRVPPRLQTQLWLLGSGLVMLSLSDSVFAYLVSSGAETMPLATDAGFIAGPALIALASLATARDAPAPWSPRFQSTFERFHLLLPYILVAITGAVIATQIIVGARIDPVEGVVAWVVVALVLGRQFVTIVENKVLLDKVSATQDELAYQARHDPLTGLANRSLFNERLDAAMEARQSGRQVGLLLIDLDDFKSVNDSLGHAAGDRLLSTVGERLRGCVREGDTVARLGGDEFAVVLDGSGEIPRRVGERILEVLQHPYEVDGNIVSLGACVGVVESGLEEPDLTIDGILRRADGAMYAGKRRGKASVVEYGAGDLWGERRRTEEV